MFRHTPLQRMSLTCPRPLSIRADSGKVQSSTSHGTSFYVPGSRKSLLLSHYTPTDSNAPFLRAYHNARFCSLVSKILTKNPFTSSGCELCPNNSKFLERFRLRFTQGFICACHPCVLAVHVQVLFAVFPYATLTLFNRFSPPNLSHYIPISST